MPRTLGRSAAPTAFVARGPRYLPHCWNASITIADLEFAETDHVDGCVRSILHLALQPNVLFDVGNSRARISSTRKNLPLAWAFQCIDIFGQLSADYSELRPCEPTLMPRLLPPTRTYHQ